VVVAALPMRAVELKTTTAYGKQRAHGPRLTVFSLHVLRQCNDKALPPRLSAYARRCSLWRMRPRRPPLLLPLLLLLPLPHVPPLRIPAASAVGKGRLTRQEQW
jgi:hypothetical protein